MIYSFLHPIPLVLFLGFFFISTRSLGLSYIYSHLPPNCFTNQVCLSTSGLQICGNTGERWPTLCLYHFLRGYLFTLFIAIYFYVPNLAFLAHIHTFLTYVPHPRLLMQPVPILESRRRFPTSIGRRTPLHLHTLFAVIPPPHLRPICQAQQHSLTQFSARLAFLTSWASAVVNHQ